MVVFVKKFVSLAFCQKGRIKKKSIVAIELLKLEELKKKKKKRIVVRLMLQPHFWMTKIVYLYNFTPKLWL